MTTRKLLSPHLPSPEHDNACNKGAAYTGPMSFSYQHWRRLPTDKRVCSDGRIDWRREPFLYNQNR